MKFENYFASPNFMPLFTRLQGFLSTYLTEQTILNARIERIVRL